MEKILCTKCSCERVVKNGLMQSNQCYKCKDCGFKIRIPQCNEPIGVQEFNLNIKKEPLAAPEIISNCDSGCSTGSRVSIKADRNIASTVTTVDGQDAVFYFQIENI